MKRRLGVFALGAALLLGACGPFPTLNAKKSPSPSMPTAGSVTWASCGGAFQCGTVKVPLDYSHPQGDTISIALIRKPATDASNRIGSVLTNPGGPGASGVEFLRNEAPSMSALNRRFDLIGFDPRGVGQSAPVRCLDGRQEDAFNALDPVLDDSAKKNAAIEADKQFAAGCQQRSGKILPFLDTPSAARDMDVIRQALGDDKLTYLGFSYGTYLGQMYAHLFPTHVRALALDGVLDPTLSSNDLLLAQIVGFEQNLQAFYADCRARKTGGNPCRYGQNGDPETKLNALMARLAINPMRVGTRSLTRGLAVIGVLTPLYDESTWTFLDQALALTDQNNGSLLLRFADIYLGRNSDGTYDNQTDANYAINCLDHPVPTDVATYDALGPDFARASSLFGPATQYSNLLCAYWPVKPTSQPGPLTAPGAPTLLLIGGTGDPATPYAWAQAVNKQIPNSVLLTRRGNGHTSYDASSCVHGLIDAYLINLSLPAQGTICS